MRIFNLPALALVTSLLFSAFAVSAEKPVKHRIVDDITSYEEAKKVFDETSSKIKSKTKLDATELHEIHMITYSLEKAVAYFAENLEGPKQASAEKIAEVVELVHLGSENNRVEETKVYLAEYFQLADAFVKGL